MFGGFVRRIKTWRWGHPSDTTLLMLHDGEISNRRRVSVQAHLKRCPSCRKRALQIAQDWNSLAELSCATATDPVFEEEELMPKIQASIHAWSEANLPVSQGQDIQSFAEAKTGHQIAAVLELYLGKRAVSALLHGGGMEQVQSFDGLAQARSTLRILLGLKGSTAVEEKLLRIMEKLPDSSGRF